MGWGELLGCLPWGRLPSNGGRDLDGGCAGGSVRRLPAPPPRGELSLQEGKEVAAGATEVPIESGKQRLGGGGNKDQKQDSAAVRAGMLGTLIPSEIQEVSTQHVV